MKNTKIFNPTAYNYLYENITISIHIHKLKANTKLGSNPYKNSLCNNAANILLIFSDPFTGNVAS